jgi:hypothetical protein
LRSARLDWGVLALNDFPLRFLPPCILVQQVSNHVSQGNLLVQFRPSHPSLRYVHSHSLLFPVTPWLKGRWCTRCWYISASISCISYCC